jgi:hypothetical protein
MAHEDKKDFMPCCTTAKTCGNKNDHGRKSIYKYGGNRIYIAAPIEYDSVRRKVPYGKLLTVEAIRDSFAKQSGADFTEPVTAGIFVSLAAWASYQRTEDKTPYWRVLKAIGELNPKYSGGVQAQKEMLEKKAARSFKREEPISGISSKTMRKSCFHYDGFLFAPNRSNFTGQLRQSCP